MSSIPTADRPIRVLLVDDEPLLREGFAMIIDAQPDMEVIDQADNGDAAIEVARVERPDVILMDVRMPGTDGITTTQSIVSQGNRSKVIVLTTFDQDEYVTGALEAGASGFMLKRLTGADLVNAIRVVHRGDALLAPSVTRRLIERYASVRSASDVPPVDLEAEFRLTDREIDTFHQIAAGRSNSEIAKALDIREATVKTHVSSILVKTGCRDRVQAVILAYNCGIVVPQAS